MLEERCQGPLLLAGKHVLLQKFGMSHSERTAVAENKSAEAKANSATSVRTLELAKELWKQPNNLETMIPNSKPSHNA
jgi:hypothetical protein